MCVAGSGEAKVLPWSNGRAPPCELRQIAADVQRIQHSGQHEQVTDSAGESECRTRENWPSLHQARPPPVRNGLLRVSFPSPS